MALATLWQHAIGTGKETQPFIINVLEDNESACRIVITGNNPNMRYMSRTQRIDISWLNERFNDGIFRCNVEWKSAHLGMFLPGYLQEYLAQPTQPCLKPPASWTAPA